MSNVIALIRPASTVATVEKATDFDLFTVDTLPISGPYGEIAGKRGIFVGNNCVNIVSDRYSVHQPREIYQRFANVAEQSNLEVNRVISNRKNGGLLLSAKYDNVQILGESHDVNLTFYTSHCGKYKTFLTLDLLRIACFNQVPALYANKSRFIFAEKHYQNSLDLDLIQQIIAGIPAAIEDYSATAESLIENKFSFESFAELYREHYNLRKEQKQFDSKLEKIKNIYYNAPGQRHLDNSAYKAYQAVTYFNTHEGRNTYMKEENAYIKGGNDSLKFRDLLLAA